jgi:general secretion pathway protein G
MKSSTLIRRGGFTLIELLVVLAILALLAGLVGPQVMNALSDSKGKTAKLQIEDLGAGLDLYRLDVGRYPTTNEGLEALISEPPGVANWNGPYLKKQVVPQDPWNRPYVYRYPGENGPYDLYTLGLDNAPGGEGEAEDVVSWK